MHRARAVLDRFLLHLVIGYPESSAELEILDLAMREAAEGMVAPPHLITKEELAEARRSVLAVHVSEPVRDYVVRLVAGTRGDPDPIEGVGEHLSHPASPRGSISLVRAAQARAWLVGRDYVVPEDIGDLAPDVLRHRVGLSYRAEAEGIEAGEIIDTLLERIPVI